MGPRKRGARKRKSEDALVEEDSKNTERKAEEEEGDAGRRRKKFIGAHVGIQGGVWKAVDSCLQMGGNSFALFLGSQRSWKRPALDPSAAEKFRDQCSSHGFDPAHILPHGSYLMNCGSPKEDVFAKSQELLVDELSRCHMLGLKLYNFHPGSSLGTITTEQCVEKIAGAINHAHQQIPDVVTVLENMSGQGSTVGGKFSELRSIIDRVRDQSRVGVCLDTCHAFSAGESILHFYQQICPTLSRGLLLEGYDLAAEGGVKAMLDQFDQEVGRHYLRALHLNDSKGQLGCHLDRHEDIGKGNIGISAFRDIVNEPRLENIPLILETPGRPGFEYSDQIQLLRSLCEGK